MLDSLVSKPLRRISLSDLKSGHFKSDNRQNLCDFSPSYTVNLSPMESVNLYVSFSLSICPFFPLSSHQNEVNCFLDESSSQNSPNVLIVETDFRVGITTPSTQVSNLELQYFITLMCYLYLDEQD